MMCPMRTAEDLRERKLKILEAMVHRPGMYGPPAAVYLQARMVIDDLFWLEGAIETRTAWESLTSQYDALDVPGMVNWLPTPPAQCWDEIASVVAEFAWSHGFLQVGPLVSDADWASHGFGEPQRWVGRDGTRSELVETLPARTLEVGRGGWGSGVMCFAPESKGAWVFLDLETSSTIEDSPLLDIRFPAETAEEGLILTPHGEEVWRSRNR
jgi:hypothetical protein